MPKTPLPNLNYEENTHNQITSNASATLIIAMVKKYITNTLPSSTASSSSSSAAQVYSLSVKGDSAADIKVETLIGNYLARPNSLLKPDDITYLRQQIDPTLPLNNALDKVTLIEDDIAVQWYLPRREVFAAVIAAIMDTDASAWPMVSNGEAEKMARLQEFDLINHSLRMESEKSRRAICSTGVRHTWIQALDGYAGKELPFGDISIILKTIRAFVIKVFHDQWKVDFSGDKNPSEEQLECLKALWKPIFLLWLQTGQMPQQVLNLIDTDLLRNEIINAYALIRTKPTPQLTAQINNYTELDSLREMPCDIMPFLATLNVWILEYQSRKKPNQSSSPQEQLADTIYTWLENTFFSSHPAKDIEIFYRLERLLQALEQLKQDSILFMADMAALDNKDDYFLAHHFLKTYQSDTALSLERFLMIDYDHALLDKHLQHFDRGHQVLRKSLYKDFISNFFSSWFAGDDRARAQLFKVQAELYFIDLAAIECGDNKRILFLTDAILAQWLSQHQDGILDIDIYQINRILLHALNFPVDEWSNLFLQALIQIIAFIEASFNGTPQNQLLQKLRRDAYPQVFMDQIQRLIPSTSLSSLERYEPSPSVLTPLMVSTSTIINITHYLAQTDASLDLIKKIIPSDKGLNINIRSQIIEWTPLLIACYYKKIDLVDYFLTKMNADIHLTNIKKNTALHLAVEGESLALIKLLLTHGAVSHCSELNILGNSPLHSAVIAQQQPIIDCLLEYGADINVKNSEGFSLLHVAVNAQNMPMINYLVSKKIDVNLKTNSGFSALHQAVNVCSFEIVTRLLEAGADINLQCNDGASVLLLAIQKQDYEMTSFLLNSGANVNVQNNLGVSALHIAVSLGSIALFNLVLRHNPLINIINVLGETPLHIAALHGVQMFNCLIKKGADHTIQNYKGNTVFHIAASNETHKILKTIPTGSNLNAVNQDGDTALHIASRGSCFTIGRWLLQQKADINLQDAKGNTALSIATSNNRVNTVRTLLEHDADISLANIAGMRPLDIARQHNITLIIKYLTNRQKMIGFSGNHVDDVRVVSQDSQSSAHASPVSVLSSSGRFFQPNNKTTSPLHLFVINGQIEEMNTWLASNSDVNVADNKGNTALLLAVEHGHAEIVTLLLQHNVTINHTNHHGYSAMHLACENNHNAIFLSLFAAGADINMTRLDNGDTPLHIAARKGYFKLVTDLIDFGASSHLINQNNKTPFDIAVEYKHQDIIDYLERQPPAAKLARH